MILLDTDVVSELRKIAAGVGDHNVALWDAVTPPKLTRISAITLCELEYGVLKKENKDLRQGRIFRKWLEHDVVPRFRNLTIPIDGEIARCAATLRYPDPMSYGDSFVAATALVCDMALATGNTRHYERISQLTLVDPWNRRRRPEPDHSAGLGFS